MLWSSVSIAGKPVILVVDASGNKGGWEFAFSDRLFSSLARRGLLLKGNGPIHVEEPESLLPHLVPRESFNCILLFASADRAHGEEAQGEKEGRPRAHLASYWAWLNTQVQLHPLLLAACAWESYDPVVSQEILESPDSFAPLALAPQSPVTPREASLFFLKFFTEMDLHSTDSITGRMVWFSHSKAKELLRRRRLTGKVGLRC